MWLLIQETKFEMPTIFLLLHLILKFGYSELCENLFIGLLKWNCIKLRKALKVCHLHEQSKGDI